MGGESRCEGTEISNVGAGGAGAGGEQRAKQEGAWFILRHQMWSFLRTESETQIHQSGMIHGLGYYCFRWNKVCVCACVCVCVCTKACAHTLVVFQNEVQVCLR